MVFNIDCGRSLINYTYTILQRQFQVGIFTVFHSLSHTYSFFLCFLFQTYFYSKEENGGGKNKYFLPFLDPSTFVKLPLLTSGLSPKTAVLSTSQFAQQIAVLHSACSPTSFLLLNRGNITSLYHIKTTLEMFNNLHHYLMMFAATKQVFICFSITM